ncbi:MAG: hypothetical protein PUP93_17610 [Rhizonema sp. NSF051]|nr:hypothetical protein [Rhizonema sp. NSF051]
MLLISKKIRTANALFLMGLGVPLWLFFEALSPQIVQAYTARVDLSIDRLPEENYETLLRRAETAARAGAQRSFDRDILVTDVSIIVSVQNYGAIAPVLELAASRPQWRSYPDPKRWATYFKSTRSLLYFESTKNPTSAQVPTTTPTAQPQPTTQQFINTPQAQPQQPTNLPQVTPSPPSLVPVPK